MTTLQNSTPKIAPIADIPFAKVDITRIANPTPQIYQSAEFAATKAFFASSPSATRSLLSDAAQALLFTIIRNLRPYHIVEIGTYKAGTSEGMARALHSNGMGMLYTVSPFDAEYVNMILPHWPSQLMQHVRYHQMDSMAFFMQLDAESIRPDLVLIDGNHDYEFASFDLQASARRINIGGFIFVDNVSQAGPYFACRDFLASHPDWIDCAVHLKPAISVKAFSPNRTNIPMTDFFVLRAPAFYAVNSRPVTLGATPWSDKAVSLVRLSLQTQSGAGTLHVQCILRGFSESRLAETSGEATILLEDAVGQIDVAFQKPIVMDGAFDRYTVEIWVLWLGPTSLTLDALPHPY